MSKRYRAWIPWHCSVLVEFEADENSTEDELADLALAIGSPSLCYNCADNIEMGEAMGGEAISIEEADDD